MTERRTGLSLPPVAAMIASALVILGIGLWMFAGKQFLFIAGLGAFGPGILRELGLLRDHDEFQRQAAHRAGYHAYLIGGLATVLIVSGLRWRDPEAEVSSEWIFLILLVLWTSWLFSALLAFWGARKTASRVLMTFGSFWAVFVLASLLGERDPDGDVVEGLLGVLAGIAVVLPFFGLAWTAHRRPRLTGALLLAVSAGFLIVFGPKPGSALSLATQLVTASLLIVPLVSSGVALLREGNGANDDESRSA